MIGKKLYRSQRLVGEIVGLAYDPNLGWTFLVLSDGWRLEDVRLAPDISAGD